MTLSTPSTSTEPAPLISAAETETSTPWRWLGVALLAQVGWGAYPALLRYLQTVSGIPSLSLLAVGNLLVLILVGTAVLPRTDKRVFRRPIVWLFGLMVMFRGTSNLLATRFTLATYAQLIYLMTPFLVALLSRLVLRESLPPHTFSALALSLVGALLIMAGDMGRVPAAASAYRNDPLGITLAIASSFFLALYMIVTRRTTSHQTPGEALLIVHLVSLFSLSAVASFLLGEDWGRWRLLAPTDWLIFATLAFGILLGANLGQIRAIQRLGASLVSTIMAIRLVSALLVAGLLLGERLTTGWQLSGAAIVIVTITWYLRQQNPS